MAQPPEMSETFVREVDENLRRDQLRDFFNKYGNWLIAAVVLFLGSSAAFIWWQQHQAQRAQGQVEELAQIYQDIGSGDTTKAPQQLDGLSKSSSKAVRASAQFARAALALQQNDSKAAVAIYNSIASDSSLPQPYRDAALIRQTAIEFDDLKPEQVIARLGSLAKPGEPWFGTAGEMTGLALIKQGKNQEAGQLFATIAKDQSVPEPIRNRAAEVASSLGVEASPAPQPQAQ